jgi:hypothetical protein
VEAVPLNKVGTSGSLVRAGLANTGSPGLVGFRVNPARPVFAALLNRPRGLSIVPTHPQKLERDALKYPVSPWLVMTGAVLVRKSRESAPRRKKETLVDSTGSKSIGN